MSERMKQKKPNGVSESVLPTRENEKPASVEVRVGELEQRFSRGTVELRADDGAAPKIQGYAAVFNSETVIGGGTWGFREVILPGAFKDAIQKDDVRGLFNHDENFVLGRNTSGTLQLVEDAHGLRYVIDPPDTAAARDLVSLIKRGDIDGSSFAFSVPKGGDDWSYDDVKNGKLPLRTVKKVSLYDVSPVTYPAYPATSVSARAKQMAAVGTQPVRDEPARAAARDDGSTGGGSTGDVGGDVGGASAVEASAKAIRKAMRKLASASKAVRAMVKALDISHGFNPLAGTLTDQGGAGLDTGRKRLSHRQQKLLKRHMKAFRDNGSGGVDANAAYMYYTSRNLRTTMRSAQHAMNGLRTMCREAGIDLSSANDADAGAGTGTVGSDAGSGGANSAQRPTVTTTVVQRAQELVELERLSLEIERERLQ